MSWRVWIVVVALGDLGVALLRQGRARRARPFTVVFCRVALAALALNLVRPLRRDARWRTYFAMGALNNVVPFALIFWGQTHIASGLASILNATTPLFTVVVACTR